VLKQPIAERKRTRHIDTCEYWKDLCNNLYAQNNALKDDLERAKTQLYSSLDHDFNSEPTLSRTNKRNVQFEVETWPEEIEHPIMNFQRKLLKLRSRGTSGRIMVS
jgi:hypothetical protein